MVNMIKGTIQEIAFNVAEAKLAETSSEVSTGLERTIFVLGSKEVVWLIQTK